MAGVGFDVVKKVRSKNIVQIKIVGFIDSPCFIISTVRVNRDIPLLLLACTQLRTFLGV